MEKTTTRKTILFAIVAAISVASAYVVVAGNVSTITTTVSGHRGPANAPVALTAMTGILPKVIAKSGGNCC